MDEQQVENIPEYEEKGFLSKVGTVLSRIGKEGLEKTFLVYHVMKDPETPKREKGILAGSLAYFILPTDVIPDVLLGIGYTDDLAMLGASLVSVAASVRPKHHALAKASVDGLAGRGEASSEKPGA